MCDLPGPGLEPLSPALAGGFLTIAQPGKPHFVVYGVCEVRLGSWGWRARSGGTLPCLFLVPGGSGSHWCPWLVDTSLRSLPLFSHGLLPSVCVCFQISLLYKDTSGAHPNPGRPHLNLITSAEALSPDKVTFTGSRWA